jgi:SDR family mycofactocin-dependent oxidoreductase
MTGKVAIVSGAARGQGRAHAIALSREGADVVIFDICEPLVSPKHPGATWEDLQETRRLVEANDRRCLAVKLDARDLAGLRQLADRTLSEFGRIDTLVVNHGIWAINENSWSLPEAHWQESIDVLLTGAWKVTSAFIPAMIEGDRGGSIILTASVMGLKPQPGGVAYTAAKHGVVALMRTLSWELGEHRIRVNAVLPGSVATPMTQHGGSIETGALNWSRFYSTDRVLIAGRDGAAGFEAGWLLPETISHTVVFLACDDSAYITGVALPVDAGWLNF